MAKKQSLNAADYIQPLIMNGLQGRMLRLKPKPRKTKEILLIYGQHASLERFFGIAEALNKYGGVTVPDLPGFGGMQSFYRLKEKPTIDNLADYLAAFVKLRYKNRRVTVVAVSFGFAVVTRMLQRYPELAKKVDLLVSVAGFVHKEDFHYKPYHYWMMRYGTWLFSFRLSASAAKHLLFRPSIIGASYKRTAKKAQTKQAVKKLDERTAYEIHLWRVNDLRTYMYTTSTILNFDLCNATVNLPVQHLAFSNDHFLNSDYIEQHLGVIYKKVQVHNSKLTAQTPNITYAEDLSFMPATLKRLLAKS